MNDKEDLSRFIAVQVKAEIEKYKQGLFNEEINRVQKCQKELELVEKFLIRFKKLMLEGIINNESCYAMDTNIRALLDNIINKLFISGKHE